ncbi:MAG: hypothetical protein HC939_18915 [Pleurocapsa sp. SU_5_0]|nr:hypothetical protein [Pleurocapsa sp. SU_5_0]NJO98624.1 hypothetical protein [Pleurocapsa sp. CRU_1_2]
MLEQTTIEQIALNYLLSNLEIHPEHRHLFEVVGTTCFDNNEWMINISIVGLVGKYWNVFVDGTTGKTLADWEFNTDCQDFNETHQYLYLPDYLNQLLDRLTAKVFR